MTAVSDSLTVGLAVLGGLTLAAVVAWNAWSTRRRAPRQARQDRPQTGPGESSGSTEPVLEGAPPAEGSALASAAGPDVALEEAPLGPLPAPERRPGLDVLIDVIAPIELEGDARVSGDAALAALPPTRRVGSKPFAVEGLNETTGEWEPPRSGQRYTAFQAGVQLANRNGPLNEIEFSEFVVKAQAFADTVGGTPDFPEMRDEVSRARELDQFASTHDAQLSLTLRARSAAWSPGYLHQHAARLGFVPGVIPGRMVLPVVVPSTQPVLSLSFDTQAALAEDPAQAALHALTLSVDVPQVPRTEQPFARMREVALALAQAMDGILTDDRGQPIRPEALDAIAADLEALYDTLDARDLAAGSPQAQRLFS
jgi:hypothetical protein